MNPARVHYDKLLLLAAILALVGSYGWVQYEQVRVRSKRDVDAFPKLSGSIFRAPIPNAPVPLPTAWSEPQAQSPGTNWRFELFTPPPLHVDASGRVVGVSQMENPVVASVAKPPGWSLVAIRPEPYRLQLTGYLGSASGYLAAFASPRSQEMWLVREGHRFEELGLSFLSFAIRRVPANPNESDSTHEEAAIALVRDEWEGRDVQLDSGRVLLTETVYAVVRLAGTADKLLELRTGDTFASGAFHYRLERIQREPAEIVVSRIEAGEGKRELHVLALPGPMTPAKVASLESIPTSIRKNPNRPDP